VNPFYFGQGGRALYGVHHPPRGSTPRSAGIVLCYPFALEYMRAHRAFRQMALLLSGEGFHVLRFDYSGTGDSFGGPDDISTRQWNEDLGIAIEELMDVASVESVWLVGLRFGGAVAMRAIERPEVAGVVLWDPLIDGRTLLEEAAPLKGRADMMELGGTPLSPALRKDIAGVNLLNTPLPRGLKVLLAVSSDAAAYTELRDRLSRDGAEVTYTCVPSDGRWNQFDNWGSALIPQALIRSIVDFLKQNSR
jgi:pimeloyl-ACP methyl ester carboxylesterase